MFSQQPLPSAGGDKDSAFDSGHLYASSSAIVLVPRKRVPVTRSSAAMECCSLTTRSDQSPRRPEILNSPASDWKDTVKVKP